MLTKRKGYTRTFTARQELPGLAALPNEGLPYQGRGRGHWYGSRECKNDVEGSTSPLRGNGHIPPALSINGWIFFVFFYFSLAVCDLLLPMRWQPVGLYTSLSRNAIWSFSIWGLHIRRYVLALA